MVSRGLIKEFSHFELINLSTVWFLLKDYAIDLEINRDFLRDMIILLAPTPNPDKFSMLDKIQELYDRNHKSSSQKLIDQYKELIENSKGDMVIRLDNSSNKKVSDLVANMKEK